MELFFYQLADRLSLYWLVEAWSGTQPTLEVLHYTGHILLFGCILLFDLRLLGLGKSVAINQIYRLCVPASAFGFGLAVVSGLALFLTNSAFFWGNPMLVLKLWLMLAALVNLGVFHLLFDHRVRSMGPEASIPAGARLCAFLSFGLWIGVISCGRLIAYF